MSSRSGPTRRVALQRRDLAILEELVLRRAETLDELHERFFAGLSRKRAVNRLAQLARAGYLHPADVVLHGEARTTRAYTLGPKARAALELRSLSSEHFRFRRWNPTLRDSSIPHQIVVNRLGRALRLDWIPEHLLPVTEPSGARHRPDAVAEGVRQDGSPGLVGFEIDLGHYSSQRLEGKLAAWRQLPDADVLVIVVPDAARRERVSRWLGESRDLRVWTAAETVAHLARTRDEYRAPLFGVDVWCGGTAWERSKDV